MGSDQRGEPHVVRLRGPWTDDAGRRISLPAVWGGALDNARSAVLTRSFHRPPRLDLAAVERFTLRVESPQQIERLAVNGVELADGADLLSVLRGTNRVTVSLVLQDSAAEILTAWLEIRGK